MPVLATPLRRHGVRVFLLLTFSLTWLPFIPALWGGTPVPLLMPFAPALACVVVRRWVTKEGFADVGLRPDLRVAWPLLVLALLWPLAAMPLAVVGASAVGAGSPELAAVDLVHVALWMGASLLAMPVFLGEELGWRGYLQVRIFPGRPLLAASATGGAWALWHFPLWLLTLDLPLWVLPLMIVSLTVFSVFLGWVQTRSRTVWAPALGHSTNNTFESSFGSMVFAGGTGSIWLPLGPSAVIVVAETVVLLGAVALGARRRPTVVTAAP